MEGFLNHSRKNKKVYPWHQVFWKTNFYPSYDSDNDQVDPVSSISKTFFQPIIPNYEISTSETRDQGLGPALEMIDLGPLNTKQRDIKKSIPKQHSPQDKKNIHS